MPVSRWRAGALPHALPASPPAVHSRHPSGAVYVPESQRVRNRFGSSKLALLIDCEVSPKKDALSPRLKACSWAANPSATSRIHYHIAAD